MTNLGPLIDSLGLLKAQIADLTAKEKAIKDQLIAAGIGPNGAEGDLYRATVTESTRAVLDMDAVKAKLSRQFIAANTTHTVVVTVRCVAKTRK